MSNTDFALKIIELQQQIDELRKNQSEIISIISDNLMNTNKTNSEEKISILKAQVMLEGLIGQQTGISEGFSTLIGMKATVTASRTALGGIKGACNLW